jgi:hypothetical protein
MSIAWVSLDLSFCEKLESLVISLIFGGRGGKSLGSRLNGVVLLGLKSGEFVKVVMAATSLLSTKESSSVE